MTLSLSTIYAKAAHVSVCPSVRLSDNFLSVCSSVQTAVCVHFLGMCLRKVDWNNASVSLSLSLTHTHTHADTQFHFFFHYRFTSKKSLFSIVSLLIFNKLNYYFLHHHLSQMKFPFSCKFILSYTPIICLHLNIQNKFVCKF